MTNAIEPARAGDLDAVLQLLRDNALPVDGLSDHLANTLVVRHGDRIVGSAALEVYGDGALLRSVAVAPGLQRSGLGRALTDAAIDLARQRRIPALFLLTMRAKSSPAAWSSPAEASSMTPAAAPSDSAMSVGRCVDV